LNWTHILMYSQGQFVAWAYYLS